jgi:AraC-like DNA-binding protein
MFAIEMESKDDLQNDMLLMMLKRLLILCTCVQRANGVDYIWQNNWYCGNIYLVESNFKTKHQVDYAEMLNKSPKTLSNLFKIQRKVSFAGYSKSHYSEARRLLHYSDKSIKEIAYEIGYEDIQSFSRFLRKWKAFPSDFKRQYKSVFL